MQTLLDRIKALEDRSKPSVETLKKNITQYAFRQATDFDKYKALEMVDDLRNVAVHLKHKKADYFTSVHAILLERIAKPVDQFKSYVLSLLGDRDYDKIMEAVGKVDKNFSQDSSSQDGPLATPSFGGTMILAICPGLQPALV